MFSYCANSFAFLKILGSEYWCSKEQSCGQKTLNLASFSTKEGCTASEMILVLADIVIVILGSLLLLLSMTNIMLQICDFFLCQ